MNKDRGKMTYRKAQVRLTIYGLVAFLMAGIPLLLCVPSNYPIVQMIPIPITFYSLFWYLERTKHVTRRFMYDD